MTITAEAPAQETAAMGSRIITALETAWTEIQAHHAEVPDVVMITGTGIEQSGARWGHHWAGRWHHDDAERPVTELFLAGERLNDGGRLIMQTLLHEAAHALSHVRGIKDTSDGGRWHNRRFAKTAEEMGLTAPTKTHKRIGFSSVIITEETAERYAAIIEELEAGRLAYLMEPGETPGATTTDDDDDQGNGEGGEDGGETTPRSGRRIAVVCACATPRRLSITPKQHEAGALFCGNCGAEFTPAEED